MDLKQIREDKARSLAWESRRRDDLRMFFSACQVHGGHHGSRALLLRASGLVVARRCVVQEAPGREDGPEAQWRASDPDDPHGSARTHITGMTILDLLTSEGPTILRAIPLERREEVGKPLMIVGGQASGWLGEKGWAALKPSEEEHATFVDERARGYAKGFGTRGKVMERELDLVRSFADMSGCVELYRWSDKELVLGERLTPVDGNWQMDLVWYVIRRPEGAYPRIDPVAHWDVPSDAWDRAHADGIS